MVEVKEEARKGPWTEQEDLQLVLSVRLLGERHWDFIAQVSGLNRTGKSCRLRWVNYLHPGLKRGRMTPDEERLVLDLHSRWGNRWSRIARRLPGRTDNEIKNYWRTHMRKRAQERRKMASSLEPPASPASSSPRRRRLGNEPAPPTDEAAAGEPSQGCSSGTDDLQAARREESYDDYYPMEEIWNDIESSETAVGKTHYGDEWPGNLPCSPLPSPPWDYSWHHLWKMDEEEEEEEHKMLLPPQDLCLGNSS